MAVVFDTSVLSRQESIPAQFVWPAEEAPGGSGDAADGNNSAAAAGGVEEIDIPVVDLGRFLRGGGDLLPRGMEEACERHGFFQVVNHGVDPALIAKAYRCLDSFFARPLAEKQRAQRRLGENHGYASSFTGRFDSKLPWKETLSFNCPAAPGGERAVVDYFVAVLGEGDRRMGEVYQEYCDAMTRLSLDVTEVLAVTLGLDDRGELRRFFAGSDSVMRLNQYPPCRQPHLTLGTGPHHDPTSLTMLHQDAVGGLQVFVGGAWRAVRPRADAFVVNIGDTFAALTNGRHHSCLHRAVVNSAVARRSLTFFLNPQLDRVVRPPPALLAAAGPRTYPDFTWREFLEFTQKRYRSDASTMDAFVSWIREGRRRCNGQDGDDGRGEEEGK